MSSGTKRCFFKKINKKDKPLATLTRKRREKTQAHIIGDEMENITFHTYKNI